MKRRKVRVTGNICRTILMMTVTPMLLAAGVLLAGVLPSATVLAQPRASAGTAAQAPRTSPRTAARSGDVDVSGQADAGSQTKAADLDAASVEARVADLRRRAAGYRKSGLHAAAKAFERHAARLERRTAGRGPDVQALDHATKLLRLERLFERYGEQLREPALVAELAAHGRRTAWLARIKSLAATRPDSPEKQALLVRIDRVVGKENARHKDAMASLTRSKAE